MAKKAYLVNFSDGQVAIHEAETSQEIFNQFKSKVSSCIDLELIRDLITEYDEHTPGSCICGHAHPAHFNHSKPPWADFGPVKEGECKYCDCNHYEVRQQ